jgi:DNA-binding NarL/FixJ family response regulator
MSVSQQNACLLVVDDDAIFLRLATGLLSKAFPDYRVLTCAGLDTVDWLEREAVRLVVTDLYMPDIDGLELVSRIRTKFPDVPVVVMTAHGSELAAVKALRAGAASYVPKQRLGDELVDTVRWVLAVRAQQQRHEEVFDYMHRVERKFILPSRSELIAPVVTELQNDLRRLEVCLEEDLVRFGVAMTEALMNAMIHGNLGLPGKLLEQGYAQFRRLVEERLVAAPWSTRRVFLEMAADRSEAVCVIRDEGDGFDPASLMDPTDIEAMQRPHGRGLLLIRTFMDEVTFNPSGNQITLVKRRALAPAPGTQSADL